MSANQQLYLTDGTYSLVFDVISSISFIFTYITNILINLLCPALIKETLMEASVPSLFCKHENYKRKLLSSTDVD